MYNRSAIKFVPCGRPPRRLSVDMYRKEPAPNTTYDIKFVPCGRPPRRLSVDMYVREVGSSAVEQ